MLPWVLLYKSRTEGRNLVMKAKGVTEGCPLGKAEMLIECGRQIDVAARKSVNGLPVISNTEELCTRNLIA